MPISNSDLVWYTSYTKSTDPASVSSLTGNKGGSRSTTAMAGTIHEILRAVSGTDTAAADFVDYAKVYWRNNHASIDAVDPRFLLSSLSSYTQDEIAVSVGLAEGTCLLTAPTTKSVGQEDYDEDTSVSTTADSAYPRVAGLGTDIASVDTYSLTTTSIPSGSYYRLSIPATGNAITGTSPTNDKYVKLVGVRSGAIVKAYAHIPGGLAATSTRNFLVNRDNSGSQVQFDRVYCATVHSSSGVASSGGAEGILISVTAASAMDITFQRSTDAAFTSPAATSAGKFYGAASGNVGQVFVPAFWVQGDIDSEAEGILLPNCVGTVAGSYTADEYQNWANKHVAFWVRRKISMGASPNAAVKNTLQVVCDSA